MRGLTPFSIRLAPATRANLEAIQRELSARTGEKITLAQVVDRLLDGPVPRYDLFNEMEALRLDPHETISQINQKLVSRTPYRRSDWLFLVEQILEDAEWVSSHQAVFDRLLWSTVYDTLIYVAALFPEDSPVLRYVASKVVGGQVSFGDEFKSSAVQNALADEKMKFLLHPNPIKNSYVARALYVAIRDGGIATDDNSNISDENINNALSELKIKITKLATRSLVDKTGKPILGRIFIDVKDNFKFVSEKVSLSSYVEKSGDLVTVLILGTSGLYFQIEINGFGQISDLNDCLSVCGLSVTSKSKSFEVRTPHSEGEDTYLITDKGTNIRIGEGCLVQMREGLGKLLTFEPWAVHLEQLRDAYGR